MKPAPFELRMPASVAEAVGELAAEPEAAVLAGGQSLLVELRYRQRRPPLLVDVSRIGELHGWAADGDRVRFGALTRHTELEHLPLDEPLGEVFRRIAPYVAHPPIRRRGTLGGSLAWAHPAAEWNAVAVALGATVHLSGPAGDREVAAADWFRGRHATDRRAGELLTAVSFPRPAAGTRIGWAELRRTHGSFAMAAALVTVTRDAGGRITQARVGLANAADVPLRVEEAEQALNEGDARAARAAGALAAAAADPADEPHSSAEYRRHAVAVLTERAAREALS